MERKVGFKMNKTKVYCLECKYCKEYFGSASKHCVKVTGLKESSNNMRRNTYKTYASFNIDNKNNNCPYYEAANIIDKINFMGLDFSLTNFSL
jgi:hypothetical protein